MLTLKEVLKAFDFNIQAVDTCLIENIGKNPKYIDFENKEVNVTGNVLFNAEKEVIEINFFNNNTKSFYNWVNQKYLKALEEHATKNNYNLYDQTALGYINNTNYTYIQGKELLKIIKIEFSY